MSHSLRGYLWKTLAIATLAGGLVASGVSFYLAYDEAQEFQDDTLRQIAVLSAGTRPDSNELGAISRSIEDPESQVTIVHLPADRRPAWLPTEIADGLHTLAVPGRHESMRVFVRSVDGPSGRLVVAQSTVSRNEIAINSALRTGIPTLLLLPLLVAAITWIIGRELRPLRRLASRLDEQSSLHLHALPRQGLPDEVTPFVDAINRLMERVNRLTSQQRRFVADAAHELRSPLSALSLQAQNLARADSAEQIQERLLPLQQGIERARKLTVQLLDLARLQEQASTRRAVDLAALLRELVTDTLPLADAKRIDLGMEKVAGAIESGPESLRLILGVGLENALRYTPEGGEVTLRVRQTATAVCIEILDTGPGIPDGEIEQAFEPFHRLANHQETHGSGLGLAIAREAADAIGAEVSLHNRTDRSGLIYAVRIAT
jgi:two-component system OmpR family sensor kinase